MPKSEKFKITPAGVLLYVLLCSLSTLINTFTSITDLRRGGHNLFWEPLIWEGTSIFVLGLLSFGVYRFVASYPMKRHNWPKRLLGHVLAALIFSVIHTLAMVGLRKLIYMAMGSSYQFGDLLENLMYELSKDIFAYASIVFVSFWLITRRTLNREKMHALSLEAELSALELRRLREQLRPHFLFNTLNLISSCMYEDVEKADSLMADLCTLLRHSLNEENLNTSSLVDEFKFLEIYLSLLNQRFSGRLSIEMDKSPETASAQVPRFLLQPLVENAVEHGFKDRGGEGKLLIRSTRLGDRILLEVIDNGKGLVEKSQQSIGGLGLRNCHGILNQLYGEDYRLQLEPVENGGVRAVVEIPYSEEQMILNKRQTDANPNR